MSGSVLVYNTGRSLGQFLGLWESKAGALARLLATQSKILHMDRDQRRSDAIVKLALTSATLLGCGPVFEGSGILV